MSLIITIYLNEGFVMAADSRTTFFNKQTIGTTTTISTIPFSDNARKIFIAPNNCGVATCGDSSYLNKPIEGFIQNFFNSKIKNDTAVLDLANSITDYFTNLDLTKTTLFHICGYELNEKNEYEAKLYFCTSGINKNVVQIDTMFQGALWNGETQALAKLLKPLIIDPIIIDVPQLSLKIKEEDKTFDALVLEKNIVNYQGGCLIQWNLMNIADAIEFINFSFETTINYMKFQPVNKTVGGPIDILVIKPHKSKWIQKKVQF